MKDVRARCFTLLLCCLWTFNAYGQQHRIHYTLLEDPPRPLPAKLIAVPAHILVREVTAGGVLEPVPKWTEAASENLTRALSEIASTRGDINAVSMPELDAAERDLLDQYLATYLVVGSTAHFITLFSDPAWEHKRKHFDYTLGTGLDFLKDRSGADAAIFIVGDDIVSTGERKAVAVIGALFGVVVPLGRSLVSVGIVDLANGDLLWMQHTVSGQYDLKDYESAKRMLQVVLSAYPGLSGRRR